MNDIEVLEIKRFLNDMGNLTPEDYDDLPVKEAIENLLKENKDLQKSVDQIYDNYQDISKMYFNLTEKIEKKIEKLKAKREKVYIQFLESNKTDKELHSKGLMLEGMIQVLEELLNGKMWKNHEKR